MLYSIPGLSFYSASGKTPVEALKEAEKAKKAWMDAAQKEGKAIPKPRYRPTIYQYSN